MPSARFRRSAMCRRRCTPGRSARSATARPRQSMQLEVVPTWPIGEDEVLVLVMAAGVNYNGVWAGLGQPISPFNVHKHPFHVAGSDASGVVWAVGSKVKRWKVGDEVIVHCNQDDGDDEECNGGDPMFSPSQRIWGYETPDGSFAQFCRVQSRQLMPKPGASHLGGGGLLHADARHRLSHAVRPCAAHAQARRQRAGLGRFGRPRRVRRAALRRLRRQCDRRDLRRNQARLRARPRRQGRHQPQGLQLLGPDAHGQHARIQRLGEGGAQVRQGDLGHHRQEGRRHRVRASGRGDVPGLVPRGEARRHGGVLRRHLRLQHHLRRALCLDAAEAHPGLALRASEAGERRPTSS